MIRLLRYLTCMVFLLAFVGCGGVKEKEPPKTAPEMSPEKKKEMQDEIKRMKKMYKKY